MKRFATTAVLAAIISLGLFPATYALDQKDPKENKQVQKEVTIGKNLFKVTESDSSVDIRVGNRGLSILESLEGKKSVKLERYNDNDTLYLEDENPVSSDEISENNDTQGSRDTYSEESSHDRYSYQDDYDNRRERRRGHFRGHWTGLELGFNNYTNSRHRYYVPDDIGYMTLHSGKSMNFNLNFAQVNLGITKHIGFVTGAGINWNNYKFDGNNNIIKGANGVIEEFDPGSLLKKSKFSTIYLTLPFLLEIQLPTTGNHLNIAAGPIGAVKITSHSKIVYDDGEKVKSASDFSLNMLRYGATARIGFSNLQFYGTYYMTPLFQEMKGPNYHELYPFEIGLSLTFND